MHAHRRDLLELAGTFLAGLPSLVIEWSLLVQSRRAVVRDRVLFSAGRSGRPDNDHAFAAIGAFLRVLDVPEEMLGMQSRLAPDSTRQGIGIVLGDSDDPEICLYVQHVDRESGSDHCDAWKARANEPPVYSHYEFHDLPCTPAGIAPVDLIHDRLRLLYDELEQNERLRATSGFWLRHGRAGIDQISLTYPWQPAVGTVLDAVQRLLPADANCVAGLEAWRGFHFRHIAMNAPDSPEPALTFYFSGSMRGPWPADVAEMRERVNLSARRAHLALESMKTGDRR